MSARYHEQVIDNLEHLRLVAFLHPRLAVVGIDSELERMMRDIFPEDVIEEWIAEWLKASGLGQRPPRFPETIVIRRRLYRLSEDPALPEHVQDFLSTLERRAGTSRHGATRITIREAQDAIDHAIDFVRWLRTRTYVGIIFCDHCGETFDYALSLALDAAQGQRVTAECPYCGEPQVFIGLPDIEETVPLHIEVGNDASGFRKQAILGLCREIRLILASQWMNDEIAQTELDARTKFLVTLEELSK